jgi:hypothetical protein
MRIDGATGNVAIKQDATAIDTRLHIDNVPDSKWLTLEQNGRKHAIGAYYSSGATDSRIDFYLSDGNQNGGNNVSMEIYSSGNVAIPDGDLVFNTSGHGIRFADGTTQTTASAGTWSGVTTASNATNTYTFENDYTGTAIGHTMSFITEQDGTYSQIGMIDFKGVDSNGTLETYGSMDLDIRSSTSGSEESQFGFNVYKNGSWLNHAFSIDGGTNGGSTNGECHVYQLDLKVTNGRLRTQTSWLTGGTDTAVVAQFTKAGQSAGTNITVYEDNDGYSGGFMTNAVMNTGGGASVQDTTNDNGSAIGGLHYFQDTRPSTFRHTFTAQTSAGAWRDILYLDADSNMNATFGGKIIASSSGIQFNDGTTQTTASSGGLAEGKAIAFAQLTA